MSEDIKKVLNPPKEAMLEAQLQAPDQIEELQQAATIDARKCMNAMNTVGAALTRAINSNSMEPAKTFEFLLAQAAKVSRAVLIRWGINPEQKSNRWMTNVVEKSLMSHLPLDRELSEEEIDVLAKSLVSSAADFQNSEAFSSPEMITVTIFSGLSDLAISQSDFDFGRKNKDEDLQALKNAVISSSLSLMNDFCPELTPTQDRVVFFNIILKQAFALMNASWQKNSIRAKQALSSLNKEQLKSWRAANPHGFELFPILEEFEKNINRLSRLTVLARQKDKPKR